MATIKLKIQADTKGAESAVANLDAVTDELKQSVQKLNNEFNDKSIKSLNNRLDKAKKTYTLLGDEVGGLYRTKSLLRAEITKLINKGLDPSDARLKTLAGNYRRVTAEIDKSKAATGGFTGSLSGLTRSFAGIAAGVYAIRGVATSFQSSFAASRDFTNEIKNVTTLTGELTFEEIRSGISSLDPVLGSATELTRGLYQALSAGVDPARAVKFVGEAAKFSKAALTDTNTAVDVLTTAINAYGLSADDAGRVSDIFFQTIRMGKTTGEELAGNLGKSIPVFSAAKIGLEELTAGLATMTLTGTSTEKATTQLNAVVSSFLKPSKALTATLQAQGYASGAAFLEAKGLAGALAILKEGDRRKRR